MCKVNMMLMRYDLNFIQEKKCWIIPNSIRMLFVMGFCLVYVCVRALCVLGFFSVNFSSLIVRFVPSISFVLFYDFII